MLKKIAVALSAVVVFVVIAAFAALGWGKSQTKARLSKKYEVHVVDLPIPFPLRAEEVEALRADGGTLTDVELAALAKERAISRGKHLVEARYVCVECHGENFGGGTMIESAAIGSLRGKNLTSGRGGVVADYKASDWDRMVRHGVKRDGTPTIMPSMDFAQMSDRELSDLVTYIQSRPPVDQVVPEVSFGPVGTMLIATGKIRITAEQVPHQRAHPVEPPAEDSSDFGKHLVNVCVGCHNPELTGGPIMGGDPSWPPAHNLTPHRDGLEGWTYEDFARAMREGKRKNGEALREPMANMVRYAKNITDPELRSMWSYLQSLEAKPSPEQ